MMATDDPVTSRKFQQINVPCVTCLVAASCQDKEIVEDRLGKDEFFSFLLGLRKWDESKKVYRKGLIEAWANLGWDLFSNMHTTEFKEIPRHAAPEFLDLLIELSGLIQWVVNSTSWQKGEKFDFDKREIESKLKKALGWI